MMGQGCLLMTRPDPESEKCQHSQSLTFAVFFFDYDLDGLLDVFAANGHVSDDISVVQPNVKYAQPAHLFRNKGNKKFEEMTGKLKMEACATRDCRARRGLWRF